MVEISSSDDEDHEIQLLASDDDDDVVAEASDDEMETSGNHVNDELNQCDASGRVLVNIGHPPDECDIYLPPQLAAAVKPHQVGLLARSLLKNKLAILLKNLDESGDLTLVKDKSWKLGKVRE